MTSADGHTSPRWHSDVDPALAPPSGSYRDWSVDRHPSCSTLYDASTPQSDVSTIEQFTQKPSEFYMSSTGCHVKQHYLQKWQTTIIDFIIGLGLPLQGLIFGAYCRLFNLRAVFRTRIWFHMLQHIFFKAIDLIS